MERQDRPGALTVLQRLVDSDASAIIVEHDLQVLRACDWLIDLGPGAGDEGGKVIAAGPPSLVAGVHDSRTATFLHAHRELSECHTKLGQAVSAQAEETSHGNDDHH